MDNIIKVLIGVCTAVIIGFLSTTFALFNKVSTLEIRADYVEKRLEECITPDKLENAKLQMSQQVVMHCK